MTKPESPSIVGIVAEYNPFHNGHLYQLLKSKELTGADYCVVVMSGDFVQRGEPAVYDKYTRAAMALDAGADLVLELPAVFAVSSANDFAACAMALLDGLGVVSHVCFGSECGDIKKLQELAGLLLEETPDYICRLRERLKTGSTYPQARKEALTETLRQPTGQSPAKAHTLAVNDLHLLDSPNNILGIEYCKALIRSKSPIQPLTVARCGEAYHSAKLTDHEICSASALRRALKTVETHDFIWQKIKGHVPPAAYIRMTQAQSVFPDDFTTLLNTGLLRLLWEGDDLTKFLDVSGGLADRIRNSGLDFYTYEETVRRLKTRQYTYTRVSRALLHILLGITNEESLAYRQAGYAPYARVLGFRRASAAVLTEIKKRGTIPLITKTADAGLSLFGTPLAMFSHDLYCSHLYQAVVQGKSHVSPKNEYTRSVIIV